MGYVGYILQPSEEIKYVDMLRVVILALALTLTNAAHAAPNQYFCIVEQSAGLHYNKLTNEWGPQVFGINRKYVLRRLTADDRDHQKGKWWALLQNNEKDNWAFFEFGKDSPMPLAACNDGQYGFACHRIINYVEFDPETLRFEVSFDGGYVGQGFWESFSKKEPETYRRLRDSGRAADIAQADDLFIEIGKCNAF